VEIWPMDIISWLKNPVAMIYCIEVENWWDTYFKHVKVETFLSQEQILVKMIILWNHWTIWKQTKQECSLEDPVYCIDLKTKTATILTGTYAKLKKKKSHKLWNLIEFLTNFFFYVDWTLFNYGNINKKKTHQLHTCLNLNSA
jgi:hypothetical protein